jgi:hypothetical protein
MSIDNSELNIPDEWLLEAENIFNRFKTNLLFMTKNEFNQFLTEFFKGCSQEMSQSRPTSDDFIKRYSSQQNESFSLNDFKKVYTELCLVKIDFFCDDN